MTSRVKPIRTENSGVPGLLPDDMDALTGAVEVMVMLVIVAGGVVDSEDVEFTAAVEAVVELGSDEVAVEAD